MKDYFPEILQELGELHKAKSHDYGSTNDPYANYRSAEQIGESALKSAFLRLLEKYQRQITFFNNGILKNESMYETCRDIASINIIMMHFLKEDDEVRRVGVRGNIDLERTSEGNRSTGYPYTPSMEKDRTDSKGIRLDPS